MAARTYTVVLERNEDNGYTVTVPALRGCVTQGPTIAESLGRARHAIECHVDGLRVLGKRAPHDVGVVRLSARELTEALVSKVTVEIGQSEPEARVA